MRRPIRSVAALAIVICTTLAFFGTPVVSLAEEQPADQTTSSESSSQTPDKTDTKKEEPPPPKTYTVSYDPNGGEGSMDSSTFVEGNEAKLARCTYTRAGYTFEGWNTDPNGEGAHFADAVDIRSSVYDGMVLYAQWGSQIYIIRYASGVPKQSDSSATGSMTSELAVHDAEIALKDCEFKRTGYTATHWLDNNGQAHKFGELGTNFAPTTDTSSWELATIEADPPREGTNGHWSCQGSVVFEGDDGSLCAAMAFFLTSDAYSKGSLDNYDSLVKVVNLNTGEVLKSVQGLMLEHANDIAYRPDNKHFYIAQGGINEGYPDGIVELDEDLNEVRTITPEGASHIWNLSFSNGRFYAIGNVDGNSFARGNPEGENSDLLVLDEDLNLLETHTIDYSLQGFSGQGMVCDGSFLYSILVNFGEHESSNKQRLAVFTLEGEPRGTQRIDITSEVESASTVDGRMYFSVNKGDHGTIYGTDLACATMSVAWEPNPYSIEFDDNQHMVRDMPSTIDTTYDEETQLPTNEPSSPGYAFVGWNTTRDGTGTSYEPGETVHNLAASGTVTLYAQWQRATPGLVGDNGTMTDGTDIPQRNQPLHAANTMTAALLMLVAVIWTSVPGTVVHFGPRYLVRWSSWVVSPAAHTPTHI